MTTADDPNVNLKKAVTNIEAVAKQGADIAVLSELFLTPYFCQSKDKKWFDSAEPIPGPTSEALMNVAKANTIAVNTSIYELGEDGLRYNTAVVIDKDGTLAGKYRKMHIPDDPENGYDEGYYFSPGNLGFVAIQTSVATIGPMICFDQWFPEGARIGASKGADLLLYPTAIGWPQGQRGDLNQAEHEAWQIMHRSHAIANNVFVAAVNHVGREGDLTFWGTSFVSDPYGRVLAKASTDTEENVIVPCDLSVIESMRKDWPFLTARVVKY